ncbi:hypothetical protein BRC61_00490 [Halobacteriales archaeon QH_10_65_19]|nr:MAG: hypothetical protein BRC61_00490 [Halobacteriales archaeon QH_10_65_19]
MQLDPRVEVVGVGVLLGQRRTVRVVHTCRCIRAAQRGDDPRSTVDLPDTVLGLRLISPERAGTVRTVRSTSPMETLLPELTTV